MNTLLSLFVTSILFSNVLSKNSENKTEIVGTNVDCPFPNIFCNTTIETCCSLDGVEKVWCCPNTMICSKRLDTCEYQSKDIWGENITIEIPDIELNNQTLTTHCLDSFLFCDPDEVCCSFNYLRDIWCCHQNHTCGNEYGTCNAPPPPPPSTHRRHRRRHRHPNHT